MIPSPSLRNLRDPGSRLALLGSHPLRLSTPSTSSRLTNEKTASMAVFSFVVEMLGVEPRCT